MTKRARVEFGESVLLYRNEGGVWLRNRKRRGLRLWRGGGMREAGRPSIAV